MINSNTELFSLLHREEEKAAIAKEANKVYRFDMMQFMTHSARKMTRDMSVAVPYLRSVDKAKSTGEVSSSKITWYHQKSLTFFNLKMFRWPSQLSTRAMTQMIMERL